MRLGKATQTIFLGSPARRARIPIEMAVYIAGQDVDAT